MVLMSLRMESFIVKKQLQMSACIANALTLGFIDSGVANVLLIAGGVFRTCCGVLFLTFLSVSPATAGL